MWFLILALFFPAYGNGKLCSSPPSVICRPPSPRPDIIPKNERDLDKLCPLVSDHLECLHSYDLACSGRSEDMGITPPLYYTNIKSFLDDACDETNALHKVLARNLPCIKGWAASAHQTCSSHRKLVTKAYNDYLNSYPEEKQGLNGPEKRDREKCLKVVTNAACVLGNILNDCGFQAYEAANDAITRTNILGDACGLDIFEELADQVESFELGKNMKEALEKYFDIQYE